MLDELCFKICNSFGQNADDFFAVNKDVIDPLDFALDVNKLFDRSGNGNGGCGRQKTGIEVGIAVVKQDAYVDSAADR